MKLTFKVYNDYSIIDNYEYSDDGFIYNDKVIKVRNKVNKLIHLFSLTSNWEDENLKGNKDGFYVSIEANKYNYNKEYFFHSSVPENFMMFVDEIKKMALEEN